MTPSPAMVEEALARYAAYIHQQAWRCARKMPRYTMYSHEDLVAEGYEPLVRCLRLYSAARGFRFITYYSAALGRHYGRLVRREWAKCGGTYRRAGELALMRLAAPPEQEALIAVKARRRRVCEGRGGP